MDFGITGKRAAVAAASRGLGLATAKALCEEGVRVVVCGRDESRIQEAAASLGGGAVGLVADLSTPDGARHFVERSRETLGGLDILVTNAGGPPPGCRRRACATTYSTRSACQNRPVEPQLRGLQRTLFRSPLWQLQAPQQMRLGALPQR